MNSAIVKVEGVERGWLNCSAIYCILQHWMKWVGEGCNSR